MTPTRLEENLIARATEAPDEAALCFRRGEPLQVTWRQLLERASFFASQLSSMGLTSSDVVGVVMDDDLDCHASIYGCFIANVPFVPMDPLWGERLLRNMVSHAGLRLIMASRDATTRFRELELDIPVRSSSDFGPVTTRLDSSRCGTTDDLALIAFTSGSTSSPKAVPLRHRHLIAAYDAARTHLFSNRPSPRLFGCVFRLSGLGILGMNYLFAHHCGAATLVMPEITISSAPKFWCDFATNNVDFVYLVPAVVNVLNKLARPATVPANLLCLSAAAPLPEEMQAAFQDRFHVTLRNGYGLTEASFMFMYGAADETGRGLPTIGRPSSVATKLLDAEGKVVSGEARGELWVAGPMVADGYWHNPEATERSYVDGGLLTGDIVERGADGSLRVVGRAKDIALRGGFTIPLDEVEGILGTHPAVLDCCAVPIDHPVSGEEVYAAVQLDTDATDTEEALLLWCRRHLGIQRSPRRILFLPRLARNSTGKLLRAENKEAVQAALRTAEQAR